MLISRPALWPGTRLLRREQVLGRSALYVVLSHRALPIRLRQGQVTKGSGP